MVITALTRNQVTGNRPWVRIPPPPLMEKKSLQGTFFFMGGGGGIIKSSLHGKWVRPQAAALCAAIPPPPLMKKSPRKGAFFVGGRKIETPSGQYIPFPLRIPMMREG